LTDQVDPRAFPADNARDVVTVMTRLRSVNIGNEALSSELLRLMPSVLPSQRVVALERAPKYLARYSYADLPGDETAALAKCDRWAAGLVDLSRSASGQSIADGNPKVELVRSAPPPQGIVAQAKRRLNLRRVAAKAGRYDAEMVARLAAHRRAAVAVLNPAGEFNPLSTDPPLRMLTELRAAHHLGAVAGAVNFSFEPRDEETGAVFAALLKTLDFVAVRDELSRQLLDRLGLPGESVAVAGDLAFLTDPAFEAGKAAAERLGLTPNTVVMVVNGHYDRSTVAEWARVAQEIAALAGEEKVVMLSNELSSDLPFAQEIARIAPVRFIDEQWSYRDYAGLLSCVRLVVSSRLHSNVLALAGGTPVVAVELIERRIVGVMKQLGYPVPVAISSAPDWAERTTATVREVLAAEAELRAQIPVLVARQREAIVSALRDVILRAA
jgi:polysaccharide pyruvyl transferase WcaK-like protein